MTDLRKQCPICGSPDVETTLIGYIGDYPGNEHDSNRLTCRKCDLRIRVCDIHALEMRTRKEEQARIKSMLFDATKRLIEDGVDPKSAVQAVFDYVWLRLDSEPVDIDALLGQWEEPTSSPAPAAARPSDPGVR